MSCFKFSLHSWTPSRRIFPISIHPLSIPLILNRTCCGGCWSRSQLVLGERRGTPWTGRQSDRQPLTLTFTPMGNLESPCLWIVGGSRSTRRESTQARGEHAISTQKGPSRPVGSNPEPSCCEAPVLATAPPCCPIFPIFLILFCAKDPDRGTRPFGSHWGGTLSSLCLFTASESEAAEPLLNKILYLSVLISVLVLLSRLKFSTFNAN